MTHRHSKLMHRFSCTPDTSNSDTHIQCDRTCCQHARCFQGMIDACLVVGVLLLVLLACFVIAQTLLHFVYLTTETNRAIFSSYRHFQTSKDADEDGTTVLLVSSATEPSVRYLSVTQEGRLSNGTDCPAQIPYPHSVSDYADAAHETFAVVI